MTEIHLSPRETQVLQGLVDGDTIEYISHKLGISIWTTRGYTNSIRKKLCSPNNIVAVAKAISLNLVEVDKQSIFIFLSCDHTLENSL